MKTCLLLTVILVVSHIVTARDGCDNAGLIKCGDKCGYECSCGGGQYDLIDESSWCCTNNTTCTAGSYTVTCQDGQLKSLTEPCNGQCNYWPEDAYRNWPNSGNSVRRSHVKCETGNQCINEEEMCTGLVLCNDTSDTKMCKDKEMWRDVKCPHRGTFTHTRCSGVIPGQCILNGNYHDKLRYQCFDRSDESPFGRGGENRYNITLQYNAYRVS